MQVTYTTHSLTGRVTSLELVADTGREELFLTAVEKVFREGKKGERLTARFRSRGGVRQLSWLPQGKKKPKAP